MGAWVILMSTPGPFPLKGEMFLTCVADLGGTSGPDLELDNKVSKKLITHLVIMTIVV